MFQNIFKNGSRTSKCDRTLSNERKFVNLDLLASTDMYDAPYATRCVQMLLVGFFRSSGTGDSLFKLAV